MTAAVGARAAAPRARAHRRAGLGWASAAAAFAALALGPRAFGVFVVVMAGVALVEGSAALARPLVLPVLPAGAVLAIGLPAYAVVDPDAALAQLPAFAAGLVIATFALLLVFGRRANATAAAASTCAVGLLVGLGATALILLRAAPGGLQWSAALFALVAVPEAAAAAAREARLLVPLIAVRVGVAAALAVLLGVLAAGNPLSPLTVAVLAVATLLSLEGARRLGEIVTPSQPPPRPYSRRRPPERRSGLGDVLAATLVSAPAALLLAQAVRA